MYKRQDILFANKSSYQPSVQTFSEIHNIAENIKLIDTAKETDNLIKIENIAHEIKIMADKIDAIELKDSAFRMTLRKA